MVKIRLARSGAKKRPFYHVVVTDQRNARDGRYIERLGFFNPVAVGGETPLRINIERVEYWQGQGAQASERVMGLVKQLTKHGEQAAPQRAAPPKSKPKAAPASAPTEAPAEEAKPEAAQSVKAEEKAEAEQAQADQAQADQAQADQADDAQADAGEDAAKE